MLRMLLACPMCFGAADSGQVRAAKIGVLVMLGFIVPVLVAIGLVARTWARRARALENASDQPQSAQGAQSFIFEKERSVRSARSAVELKI